MTSGGDTLLHRAARSPNVECVRLLLDAGADPDAKIDEGQIQEVNGG
jgi:ankyrin repeat protein